MAVVPCRGGETLLKKLFEPLGYRVTARNHPLDERFPEWGDSRYYTVTLEATCKLSELLNHLYVLIPVLDDDKHYWVGEDEVEKLLKRGEGWLASHPERDTITSRYLKRQRSLVHQALTRLIEEEQPEDVDEAEVQKAQEEAVIEAKISLNQRRLQAVTAALRQHEVKRVLDLGCGEGNLLRALLEEKSFSEIVGVDVSPYVLERAANRLRLERMPERQSQRLKLMQGSLTYRDKRLAGYDAAAVVEVIEHLDLPRLSSFERALFEFARPGVVIITTPNAEYNVKFEGLPAGKMRHRDHRFEWSRAEFQAWAQTVTEKYGYTVSFQPIGDEDALVGAPTQMAVFMK
jgi:3' terminal RNA ribose 2'-O-methyltransferase Hen1